MSFEYIASSPLGSLIPGTETKSFDSCVELVMGNTGKSWEWLKGRGYTVDRYDESPIKSPLGSKHG